MIIDFTTSIYLSSLSIPRSTQFNGFPCSVCLNSLRPPVPYFTPPIISLLSTPLTIHRVSRHDTSRPLGHLANHCSHHLMSSVYSFVSYFTPPSQPAASHSQTRGVKGWIITRQHCHHPWSSLPYRESKSESALVTTDLFDLTRVSGFIGACETGHIVSLL